MKTLLHFGIGALFLAGCGRPPAGPPAAAAQSYTETTAHAVDTDDGTGPAANGEYVALRGLVAVTGVDKYVKSGTQRCMYELWVQDPACTAPPCGLEVKAVGPPAPSATATGKDCPGARYSGTVLANFKRGDNLDVQGQVVDETDSTPPQRVIEHQIYADTVTLVAKAQTITPLIISDPAVIGSFVAHVGTGFNPYEGTLVTVKPAGAPLQIIAILAKGFETSPGGTVWGNTFDNDYTPAGATAFPTVGSSYLSISGVVSARHGGAVLPVSNSDFVPQL